MTQPAHKFTMDVNPSIEILSNRLNTVVAVNPLNEDAEQLLKNYKLEKKPLEEVVSELVDLMVLTGYISGGKDNLIKITVNDPKADQKLVGKVNQVIAAYLENKQIEATIFNQAVLAGKGNQFLSHANAVETISAADDDWSNLKEDDYEDNRDDSKSIIVSKPIITEEAAKSIATDLVHGKIIAFELDNDDDDPEYEIKITANGKKYEIEIDAYTGKVLEFEHKDDDDHDGDEDDGDDNDDNDEDDNDDNDDDDDEDGDDD